MKKRMMLIINPMAGRSGYKTGFGEVMNILDSGGYLTTVYFTQVLPNIKLLLPVEKAKT